MRHAPWICRSWFWMFAIALSPSVCPAAVTLTNAGAAVPGAGPAGITQANAAGTMLWYLDGERQPGQSFTLAAGSNYLLQGYSLRVSGQDAPVRDPWAATSTWSLQVARFENGTTLAGSTWVSGGFADRNLWDSTNGVEGFPSGTQYTDTSNAFRQVTFAGVPSLGTVPAAGDWVTWSFTGTDILTLEGGYTYSIQATPINSGGVEAYAPFDVADADVYDGGKRFSTWGGPDFGDDWVRDQDNADRSFVLTMDSVAVPEPLAAELIAAGSALGILGRAFRRGGLFEAAQTPGIEGRKPS